MANRILGILVLLVASSCDAKDSSLGGLSITEATTEAGASETRVGSASTGTGLHVGAPCTLSFMPESKLLDLENAECPAAMCLYADEIHAGDDVACSPDDPCPDEGQGVTCSEESGVCVLDPAHVAARSMCTDFCESDSDCVPAEGTTCVSGFTCAAVAAIGPACCAKVCVCSDDLGASSTDLAVSCPNGTQAGCCDQDPPPATCG